MKRTTEKLDATLFVPLFAPIVKPLPRPNAGVFDEPASCIRVNKEWLSYIRGALEVLDQPDAWDGTEAQIEYTRDQVKELINALGKDACAVATEILPADDGCGIKYRNNPEDEWTVVELAACESTSTSGGGCLPVGAVFPAVVGATPENCLLCDGTEYTEAAYPELYAAIHANFKGSGVFTVPDLRGRMVIGAGQDELGVPPYTVYDVGDFGGTETVTLGLSQIPPHTHRLESSAGVDYNRANGGSTSSATGLGIAGIFVTAPLQPLTTLSEGGTETGTVQHENRQPYMALNYYVVATPCPEGTDGIDGREIELRKNSGWVQWRYVGEGSWINLMSFADLRGEPGEPGEPGEQGTPGEPGIAGIQGEPGEPGDCPCEPDDLYGQAEQTPDDWDGQACAIADGFAQYLQSQFINSCELIKDSVAAAETVSNIAEKLFGQIPIIGGIVNGVLDFATDVASKDINDIIALTNGIDFKENVQCLLYCSFKAQSDTGGFNNAMLTTAMLSLQEWAQALPPGLPFVTFYGQAFALFLGTAFTDDAYLHAIIHLNERSDDCSILCTDCPEEPDNSCVNRVNIVAGTKISEGEDFVIIESQPYNPGSGTVEAVVITFGVGQCCAVAAPEAVPGYEANNPYFWRHRCGEATGRPNFWMVPECLQDVSIYRAGIPTFRVKFTFSECA